MHVDKHVVKMILEYCQLLSTAHRVLDKSDNDLLYKATHVNHPSAKWVRLSSDAYVWLTELLVFLCAEYTHRYGKIHKCQRIGLVDFLAKNVPKNIPTVPFAEPPCAMPDKYKIEGDAISSYRNYYNNDKAYIGKWKNRDVPTWFSPPSSAEAPQSSGPTTPASPSP